MTMFAPCLLGCRATIDSGRYEAAAKWAESRTKWHGRTLSGSRRTRNSALLIRGFGVRVPGGAPVLTWCYTRFGRPRGGRFGAMFAPRLLVSPDLVPRAAVVGPAPARSARLVCRPGRGMRSGASLPMALHSVTSTGFCGEFGCGEIPRPGMQGVPASSRVAAAVRAARSVSRSRGRRPIVVLLGFWVSAAVCGPRLLVPVDDRLDLGGLGGGTVPPWCWGELVGNVYLQDVQALAGRRQPP